jgi:hypothetical protein
MQCHGQQHHSGKPRNCPDLDGDDERNPEDRLIESAAHILKATEKPRTIEVIKVSVSEELEGILQFYSTVP